MEILHSAIAILAAILLIIRFKVDPVISLLLACVYLGLATGLGAEGTVEQITGGFGEIMAEVGLLIGFGVLIGALLHAMGAFSDLVEILAVAWVAACRTRWPARSPRSSRRSTSTFRLSSPRRWLESRPRS